MTCSGRLLQGLEEGVGRLAGEHVGFVDYVHLAAVLGGLEVDLLPDLANFLNAPVAGGVQLDDVQVAALVDGDADGALVAGVALLWVEAVDGLGQHAGGGGLAAAPGAAEQVAVADAILHHRLPERAGDVLLPGQVAECAGPPLAVIDLRRGGHKRERGWVETGRKAAGSNDNANGHACASVEMSCGAPTFAKCRCESGALSIRRNRPIWYETPFWQRYATHRCAVTSRESGPSGSRFGVKPSRIDISPTMATIAF